MDDTTRDRIRASLTSRKELQQGIAAAAKVAKQKLNALDLFRPTYYQEAVVTSDASEILVQGAPRSGKSVVVAAMIAAYALNRKITFADGSTHAVREPEWSTRPTVMWLVGLQLNHIGQTLHRLLCRAGAFDIVRDKQTGMWRAWQPGRIPGDSDIPVSERKPAPPFIPASEIVAETWENKAEFKFTSLRVTDGSMIYGFASTGDVKRGDPVNRIWIDEEIAFSSHYPEFQSRLSDRKGRIIWTSWPDAETPALLRLYRRACDQREEVEQGTRKKADVVNYIFRAANSPFTDEDEKRKRLEGWNESEQLARASGEFVTHTILAYPEFNRKYHVVDYGDKSPLNDKVTAAMKALNWNVPHDWCVDLILDPGTSRPSLLWCAIPPREFWDENEPYYIIFREMAVPRLDAREMAKRAKAADPHRHYMRFIGDSKAGLQTPPGFTWTIFDQYSKEFRAAGLRCQLTGDMFIRGETTWITRSLKLRRWMLGRNCGRPQLRIVPHTCPALVRQLEEVVKKVAKEDVKDALAEGQVHDQLDCLEYFAGFDPTFLTPPPPEQEDDPGKRVYEADKKFIEDIFAKNKTPTRGAIVLGIS
jgi:hypothetical protein